MSCDIENNTDTCAGIFYYKLHKNPHVVLIKSLVQTHQIENYLLVMSMCGTGQMTCRKQEEIFRSSILDVKRFETKYHTEVHVHIFSYKAENYLLVMSMCATGQMTCRKQE